MKIPYRWLKDYVEIDADIPTFVAKMSATGNAVEEVIRLYENMENVVAGRVVAMEKHPDADKLFVCQVDVGTGEPVQIVTGADNVFSGAYVPVALHGSRLPNGLHIKKGKLRGVVSEGMLCSGEELLLKEGEWPGSEVHGIFILDETLAKPGQDMNEYLMRDDIVIDFEVGANRADCLSVMGTAREAAAAFDAALRLPQPSFKENGEEIGDYIRVEVKNPEYCGRYMARAVKNVKIAPSPRFIKERLYAAGIRPINNIVDITNFVMLETGQPMHAFDRKHIAGGKIIVRTAEEGEKLTTLDGAEHTLTSKNLLIADEEGGIGLAGIMGGRNSEIEADTDTVIFEAAKFMYANIRQSCRALGIATESSMRFSKGIDASVAAYALHRACQLVELLGAGEVVGGEIDILHEDLSEKEIRVTPEQVNERLGTALSEEEMIACLKRVGIAVKKEGELVCRIPRYRTDLYGAADIAEEVARIYGYDNIEGSMSKVNLMADWTAKPDEKKEALVKYLTGAGYFECVTYSFMGMQDLNRLGLSEGHPLRKAVRILNPLGDDTGYMRTTLLPALLQVMSRNQKQKNQNLRLYEVNKVYLPKELPIKTELPEEVKRLVMALSAAEGDFFTLKGDMENALVSLGVKREDISVYAGGESYLHPYVKGEIFAKGEKIGEMGQVYPEIAEAFELTAPVYVVNVNISAVTEKAAVKFAPFGKYPAVERDMALVVGEDIEAGRMKDCILKHGGSHLAAVEIFDVYRSAAIGAGKKSVAYSLAFRSAESTLTDEEIGKQMEIIRAALKEEFGAELRQ